MWVNWCMMAVAMAIGIAVAVATMAAALQLVPWDWLLIWTQ